MKINLMTFSLIPEHFLHRLNADQLFAMAKNSGMAGLDMMEMEISMYGEGKIAEASRKYGLGVDCLIASIPFLTAPGKTEGALRSSVARAKRLGAKMLMVVPGGTSSRERKICGKMSRQALLDKAVAMYQLAVKLGAQEGIAIGFENTPHDFKPYVAAEDVLYIMHHVPGLQLIFDTGNFRVADTSADELSIYKKVTADIGQVGRVHVKDVVIGDFAHGETCVDGQKIRAVTTGAGVIDLEQLLPAIKAGGYDGTLVVEYAAAPGIHKEKHAQAFANAVMLIQDMWNGTFQRPDYRTIAGVDRRDQKSPKQVSRIFFGTAIKPMIMGKNADFILDTVYSRGINAFDCARGYGNAEKSLGQWIRDRNNRERITVLTKCGNVKLGGGVHIDRNTILSELATSLKNLGTDYIDIYLLHRDDPNTPVGEIIECLNEVQREGKVHVFGVSNWTLDRIKEANAYAAAHGLHGFSVSSPNFGLAEQVQDPWGGGCVTISGDVNKGVREEYAKLQMPVLCYSSLGRGFFTGSFKSFDYDTAKTKLDAAAQKGYLYEVNMQRLQRAEKIAARDHCTIAQVAMRYIYGSPMNVFAIVSSTGAKHIKENIDAERLSMTAEDIHYLETGK